MTSWPLILLSLLLLLAPAHAGQHESRLDGLFQSLEKADDQAQAQFIEGQIWNIWLLAGDQTSDAEMARGVAFMNAGNLPSALKSFNKIIAQDPNLAEGWNKRATVYYLMGNFKKSVLDIKRTLALEPRHFGAFSGLGLIYLASGEDRAALRAFDKALEIHPLYGNIANEARRLRQRIKGQPA